MHGVSYIQTTEELLECYNKCMGVKFWTEKKLLQKSKQDAHDCQHACSAGHRLHVFMLKLKSPWEKSDLCVPGSLLYTQENINVQISISM